MKRLDWFLVEFRSSNPWGKKIKIVLIQLGNCQFIEVTVYLVGRLESLRILSYSRNYLVLWNGQSRRVCYLPLFWNALLFYHFWVASLDVRSLDFDIDVLFLGNIFPVWTVAVFYFISFFQYWLSFLFNITLIWLFQFLLFSLDPVSWKIFQILYKLRELFI